VNRIRYIFGWTRVQEFEFYGYYRSDYVGGFKRPFVEVKALKLPPRASENEICCQWEFKLEAEA
jgi:hypothetical protein